MADSDDENENKDDNEGVDLTGFLFGNIDETGQLESDVFDPESQKHLSSLGKYVQKVAFHFLFSTLQVYFLLLDWVWVLY